MLYEDLFDSVSYEINVSLDEVKCTSCTCPDIFHSVISIENFPYCKRLDWYCALDKKNGKALFIDTGHPALMGTSLLDEALQNSGISWNDTCVVLTHFHIDHSGNLSYCLTQGAKEVCFVSPVPYEENSDWDFLIWTRSSKCMQEDVQTHEHLDLLNGKNYFTGIPEDKCRPVKKGDSFEIGSYHFEVMPTPGHSPEHLCLVDSDNKVFIAGDHLIFAKPGMMQLKPNQHLLASYIDSLSVIRRFNLEKVLMSHHEPLFGNDVIDDFLKTTQEGYYSLLKKAKDHVSSLGAVSAYEMAADSAAHYPDGINTFKPDTQMRRVALMFGTLEGLYDEGMVERRQDDDGAYVYFVKRAK